MPSVVDLSAAAETKTRPCVVCKVPVTVPLRARDRKVRCHIHDPLYVSNPFEEDLTLSELKRRVEGRRVYLMRYESGVSFQEDILVQQLRQVLDNGNIQVLGSEAEFRWFNTTEVVEVK